MPLHRRVLASHMKNHLAWLAVALSACAHAPVRAIEAKLVLPPAMEPQRAEYEEKLAEALRRIRAFATAQEWRVQVTPTLVSRVELFDSKSAFDARLLAVSNAPAGSKLPVSYAATVHERVLYAVTQNVYLDTRPSETAEDYTKCLVHELAHQVHEDATRGAMGPLWFFEGLSVVAADQYQDAPEPIPGKVEEVLASSDRGDYRLYGAVLRQFLKRHTLSELVSRAGQTGFEAWLKASMPPR